MASPYNYSHWGTIEMERLDNLSPEERRKEIEDFNEKAKLYDRIAMDHVIGIVNDTK